MKKTATPKKKRLALHIRVRRAMKKRGMKKKYLAEQLDMSRPTLNTKLEHGGFNRRHIALLRKERLL
jgi:DNA-binding transcriptional regulator LsrR (DeoR family)